MYRLNLGTNPNDNTGDPIRTTFQKIEANTDELDARKNAIVSTHSQLKSLKNASGLTTNTTYYLSDHVTKHNMYDGVRVLNELNIGIPEPLVLRAISSSEFALNVYSPNHPNDTIHFDFNNIICEDNITSRTGKIIYREDTNHNSTRYDFRNVKFRRWRPELSGYTKWTEGNNYTSGEKIFYVDTLYYCMKDINNSLDSPDFTTLFAKILNDYEYVAWSSAEINCGADSINSLNLTIPVKSSEHRDFYTFSNDAGLERSQHFQDVKLGRSNLLGITYNNTVFIYNGSGIECFGNSMGSNGLNTIYATSFERNIIGNDFSENIIYQSFKENIIGNNCSNNIIHISFTDNGIGNGFTNNTVQDNVYDNVIGHYFANNNVGTDTEDNVIGSGFNSNCIIDTFHQNSALSYTMFLNIGSGAINNIFNSNSNNIIAGSNMQNNTFDSICSNLIIGNNFQFNRVSSLVNGGSGFDFRPFEAELSTSSPKKIFGDDSGVFLLTYDINGIEVLQKFDFDNNIMIDINQMPSHNNLQNIQGGFTGTTGGTGYEYFHLTGAELSGLTNQQEYAITGLTTSYYSMPFRNNAHKKVIFYCNYLNETIELTFPVAFRYPPTIMGDVDLIKIVTGLSNIGCSMEGNDSLGFIIFEGF